MKINGSKYGRDLSTPEIFENEKKTFLNYVDLRGCFESIDNLAECSEAHFALSEKCIDMYPVCLRYTRFANGIAFNLIANEVDS